MAHYSEIGATADYAVAANQEPKPEAASSRTPSWGAAGSLSWKLKSVIDRLGALVLLVAIAPLMAVIALAVRIDSSGPVFFRQPRFGAGRSVIVVTKFRTMRPEGTDIGGRRQATRDDDRVTKIGRFLRKTCLDELPQIWDVLCGRMSLVGPRPHPLSLEVDGHPIEALIPSYHLRHRVRPGITGLAQINGNRGPVENLAMGRERVRYDLEYIEGHSIWLDLRILLKTLAVPFQKDGSY
jgi:lipopolysaccharide/colanic/teichoic acid biosynthesis glycosyltransferase